jgi:UTP--glucose-1-phosphate uridylyltransferase
MSADGLRRAQQAMRDAGSPQRAIDVFSHYYAVLESGETGMISEEDIEPIRDLPRLEDLDTDPEQEREALAETAVIRLNGGLGTSMGMNRAKSLLHVRPDRSFLDLIVSQVLSVRKEYDVALPLLFMNSFRTQEDTRAALERYADLPVDGLPIDFLQNREPKLRSDDLTPVSWPKDPALQWCPPGHGDLYTALEASGTLQRLLDAGYRHAFVSNADNLGARPDPRLAAWFAASGAPFGSESCRRTAADRKGGHLAVRRSDGRFVLRETAQTRPEDEEALADVTRHRFFNTNNLWLDLPALADMLERKNGVLGLPMIRNVKTVDPSDPSSPEVIQIETAMGAAIEVFEGAVVIEVDRSRFLPVKTTNDLLVLRSDAHEVRESGEVRLAAGRTDAPFVDLDKVYKFLADFDARFPHGPPSLVRANSLVAKGDWTFGRDVTVVGDVVIEPPANGGRGVIPDGASLG